MLPMPMEVPMEVLQVQVLSPPGCSHAALHSSLP
jgi:hypothetical protein